MRNYDEYVKGQIDSGRGRPMSMELRKLVKKGDKVVGEFLSVRKVDTKAYGQPMLLYGFMTDGGAFEYAFGGAFVKRYGDNLTPGNVYSIEYLGELTLKNNTKMHDYRVIDYGVVQE